MDAFKLSVKYFLTDAAIRAEEFVPIFHSWIQKHAVNEHLLVDVADYSHVHNGPGAVLVAHEANFYTDQANGKPGLMYTRKLPAPGTFTDRLRQAFTTVLEGCQRLEDDPRLSGRIKFRTDEALFRINDRLLAPNTPETFQDVKPELERFLSGLYEGTTVTLQHNPDPQSLFEVLIKTSASPSLPALLSRLTSAMPSH